MLFQIGQQYKIVFVNKENQYEKKSLTEENITQKQRKKLDFTVMDIHVEILIGVKKLCTKRKQVNISCTEKVVL